MKHFPPAHGAAVRGLAFSADGHVLASGAEDGTMCFWDVSALHEKK